ncbi:hypothetical protein BDQ12DRAFT_130880 [Crucibulum laeve]|uniref:Uncharacterized protein n=1 Tax=Crucibulum laeve TaxID=68775 RepID=A0A5C3M197_9AGAR|nr:hypothetical protein BDQ12DRAFT_130880 [Crucibulum laeve]
MSDLAAGRLKGTLQGYNMLTSVTQNAVNRQLKELYNVSESLRKLEIKTRKGTVTMSATLDPCKVQFRMGTSNKSVTFFMYLKTGFFHWFDEDQEKHKTDIKDWILAFGVNLDLRTMEKSPDHVVERLRQSGVGQPGNYTVEQLFLDFTAADLTHYEERLSHLPDLDWDRAKSDQDRYDIADMRAAFTTYMNKYLTVLSSKDQPENHTIGYIPVFKHNKVYPLPTLTPTSLDFQNYPFVSVAGTRPSEGLTGDAGLNLLLYLEMTDHHSSPNLPLSTSANWVIPGPDNRSVDGCAALSRQIFFEGWILPLLNPINRATFIAADKAEFTSLPFKQFKYGFTRVPPSDMDLSFKWVGMEGKNATFQCQKSSFKEDDGTFGKIKVSTNMNNYIHVPAFPSAQNCAINMSGQSLISVEVYAWPHHVVYTGKLNWSGSLILKAIDSEGKLQMHMEPATPITSITADKKTEVIGDWGFLGPDVNDSLKTDLGGIKISDGLANINNLLSGSYPFYFGQGSVFFMKNPVFNEEADLLIELDYKGV